jgi:hypothetical protein
MADAAEDIVAWTVQVGLDELDQADLVAGYCERLVGAGVPSPRATAGCPKKACTRNSSPERARPRASSSGARAPGAG